VSSALTILDGPLGTELERRGVPTPLPRWSAGASEDAPEVVQAIHRDYARAGATVHTANTFRTKRRTVGGAWERLARRAVALARASVPADHRVAGSIAPLEDCYRPDLSPASPKPEHAELARLLLDAGADLLLCETFPHVGEALAAVEAAVVTGLPVWVSFTAGPQADLLTPAQVEEGAREAAQRGAQAVLVNCVPADRTLAFLDGLSRAGVPFGAYANALGGDQPPERYLEAARAWVAAGAAIIGGCCGTGPAHIAALTQLR
jgi:S-methylmethionine-dependent homocysteine/selenocysteine methylase